MWADNFWILSHSKENVEQMLQDVIEEASKLDLEPKPASLRWTRAYASEEKIDMILGTSKGCYKFPIEDTFKMLGCAMNRQGKTCDAVEERMRSINKAFWKENVIYKSKDVTWKVKCQRLVDHEYAVFAFGSESWSWTLQTMEKIKGLETKTMTRLFRPTKKTRRGLTTIRERVIWPGRYGCRWACPFCVKKLQKVCGVPWDGYAMNNRMVRFTPRRKCTSGEVRDGGTPYKQE